MKKNRKNFLNYRSLTSWLREGRYAPGEFQITSWLFLRALGLIYFSAFVSFGVQAIGLIGSHGILPLQEFTQSLSGYLGASRYWLMPMLFWLDDSDRFIKIVCWGGAGLSLLLTFNLLPRICLALLYFGYLSLMDGGQTFMTYQWDILLIDAGFLGLILSLAQRPGIFMLRWLAFRFMFLSGVVKIASGEPAWRDFTALNYHFQTQPLPTPLAWYAHHLPASILACLTMATLFIELVLPFFIFYGRRMRLAAAFGILSLQMVISLTGNYNFFNLTVMALCISLFDDAFLKKLLPQTVIQFAQNSRAINSGKIALRIGSAFALIVLIATSIQLIQYFGIRAAPLAWIEDTVAPFRVANTYGPFAIMTKQREEIILEGSYDGENWKEYEFPYKPADINRRPPWNIPHQPRVDWQFWFASLESPRQNPWLVYLMQRLLEGEPSVTALLKTNPFPDHPPKYIRAMFYDYRFSTPEEKKRTGAWWERKPNGTYIPRLWLR